MANRKGGFIGQDGLNAPDEPTGVSASAGDAQATVSFTAPSDEGGSAITGYVATSNDGIGATGSSSPITVTGLTNGTAYTFRVWALNAFGYSAPSDASGSVTPQLQRALFAGGTSANASPPAPNNINYVNISTTGNASDFGDLTEGRQYLGAGASATRALWGGGYPLTNPYLNTMDYVTIASTGDATDFGDLNYAPYGNTGTSNATRCVFAGGSTDGGSSVLGTIDYVTIATTGNASSFGTLLQDRMLPAACSSSTRGIFAGGDLAGSAVTNVIEYITLASTGNGTDFGDLTVAVRTGPAACSSGTRGCIAGGLNSGGSPVNVISYVTIASTGNATDFGDLTAAGYVLGSTSSLTRGLWAAGTGRGNTIDYVTIASTGNAIDFGDLLTTRFEGNAGASSAHGGLS